MKCFDFAQGDDVRGGRVEDRGEEGTEQRANKGRFEDVALFQEPLCYASEGRKNEEVADSGATTSTRRWVTTTKDPGVSLDHSPPSHAPPV